MKFLIRHCVVMFCGMMGGLQVVVADDGPRVCEAQVAQWLNPTSGAVIRQTPLFDRLATQPIVLLGEVHDNQFHHQWQHSMLAALHARNPNIVVGLEMLPRRVQSVLDDWRQGKLDEAAFVEQSQWAELWGYDVNLYLPLLQFARLHRLPTIALNIDRQLVSKVGAGGWHSLDVSERMGLSDPAPASDDYRLRLGELYAYKLSLYAHGEQDSASEGEADLEEVMQSEAFSNFVDAQLTWDRAMAEALASAHRKDPDAQVVGIIGRGHLEYRQGIAHQLADLGIEAVEVLLPVDLDEACAPQSADLADAVFVVETQIEQPQASKPRLGVIIEGSDDGVRVMEVVADSVAAKSGIEEGDLIQRAAGFEVQTSQQLIDVIQRQAAGTWLPLEVWRDEASIELIARFPQSFDE